MQPSKNILRLVKKLPLRILNQLYVTLTGVRIWELRSDHDNLVGSISALDTLASGHREIAVVELALAFDDISQQDISQQKDCQDLATLLAKHGSDKSTTHNYHLVYASLLQGKRDLPLRILEIGIGTNNQNFPSNMGKAGKPGASLRAFRDWGKRFEVYGADIDLGVLFSEERIETYFVDQTKPAVLEQLAAFFPRESFDLIIDDGRHITWANLNTLNFALDLLKPGAFFVVEDILDRYLPIWRVALSVMPEDFRCQLVRTKVETMCLIQKG
jgi:SAM-dependent methyltransferase